MDLYRECVFDATSRTLPLSSFVVLDVSNIHGELSCWYFLKCYLIVPDIYEVDSNHAVMKTACVVKLLSVLQS